MSRMKSEYVDKCMDCCDFRFRVKDVVGLNEVAETSCVPNPKLVARVREVLTKNEYFIAKRYK